MAGQTSKSLLIAKYGQRIIEAAEAHREEPVELSNFGGLPGGVKGIAQLKTCKFTEIQPGKKHAGEVLLYASGVVVQAFPDVVKGEKMVGRVTKWMEYVCDTPESVGKNARKTIDDHIKWIHQFLKRLGITDDKMLKADRLEDTVALMEQMDPPIFFRFHTWQPPTPTEGKYKGQESRVIEFWDEQCDPLESMQPGDGVEDSTLPPDPMKTSTSYNGTSITKASVVVPTNVVRTSTAVVEPKVEESPQAFDEFDDIDSLYNKAIHDDVEAQTSLRGLALHVGVTEGQFDEAQNWDAVVELIKEKQREKEVGGSESREVVQVAIAEKPKEKAPFKVKVTDCFLYRPLDSKTKKVGEKKVECVVEAVDEKAQRVDLKSLDNPKNLYKGVAFSDLIGFE